MLTNKELLLEIEELWLSKEDDTDEWYEEGIQLYEKLGKVDSFNFAHYNKQRANLLLEKARNEKMHHGNMNQAESLLKRVIDLEPGHSEIYYRLAFINAHHEKWEAVLFYANEALEYRLSLDEEIKLSALMGCAYRKIKLHHRGKEQFEHAEALDVKKNGYYLSRNIEIWPMKDALLQDSSVKKGKNLWRKHWRKHVKICAVSLRFTHLIML